MTDVLALFLLASLVTMEACVDYLVMCQPKFRTWEIAHLINCNLRRNNTLRNHRHVRIDVSTKTSYAVPSKQNTGMHSHADAKIYLNIGDEVEVSHFT
jgi:hypothetical protein